MEVFLDSCVGCPSLPLSLGHFEIRSPTLFQTLQIPLHLILVYHLSIPFISSLFLSISLPPLFQPLCGKMAVSACGQNLVVRGRRAGRCPGSSRSRKVFRTTSGVACRFQGSVLSHIIREDRGKIQQLKWNHEGLL